MKAMITGSGGFVGRYMRRELESAGYEVTGIDIVEAPGTRCLDLMDKEMICRVVAEEQPDVVIHLAGQANVAASWKIPGETVAINVIGAVNLLEAVRVSGLSTHVVLVGSSDEYGNLGQLGSRVSEDLETRPQTPYAVSKKAQEEMARVYVNSYGMHICMTRSFNHCGPGQKQGFLVSDFSSGIARIERGEQDRLLVGNLSARRDFTHVADIVRAYRLIAEQGRPGEVYNVGSGSTWSAQEILDELTSMARCPVTVEQDPSRMRPSDTPVICCDHERLTKDTGWEPVIPMKQALQETLDYWREQI